MAKSSRSELKKALARASSTEPRARTLPDLRDLKKDIEKALKAIDEVIDDWERAIYGDMTR